MLPLEHKVREFPGCAVVRALCFHYESAGSIPGQGTKILQATWCDQKNKMEKKFFFWSQSQSLYMV